MRVQACLDNLQAETANTFAGFGVMAVAKGIAKRLKATRITDGRKAEFDPGHGHAMAILALIQGKKD